MAPAPISLLAAAACAVMLAGCGDGDTPSSTTPAPTRTASPAATATPEPAAASRHVRFKAADGRGVTAEFTPAGPKAPAVILLHQLDGGLNQFDEYAPSLNAAGYATLAYQSRPGVSELARLPDLSGAVSWLRRRRDVDPRRIVAVGASIGALTAVVGISGPERRRLRAAVALSPADSPEVFDLQDRGRYRPHDVLFISDRREASAVDNAMSGAIRSEAMVAEASGHGVVLLASDEVRDAILGWLDKHVGDQR
jgi:hypothetical protein